VYAPCIVMVSQYFDKRRSLALGIATSGSGLGLFLFPPLLELLFMHYGYMGTMLLGGALMFHNSIAGALLRPLLHSQQRSVRITHRLVTRDTKLHKEAAKLAHREHKEVVRDLKLKDTNLAQSQCNESNKVDGIEHKLMRDSDHKTTKTGDETSEKMMTNNKKSETELTDSKKEKKKSHLKTFSKYLDLSLWNEPAFVMFVLSLTFATSCYFSAQYLMVALAHSRGVPLSQGSFLLSIIGIMDMLTRLGSGNTRFFFSHL
jgi:hypothetical protein